MYDECERHDFDDNRRCKVCGECWRCWGDEQTHVGWRSPRLDSQGPCTQKVFGRCPVCKGAAYHLKLERGRRITNWAEGFGMPEVNETQLHSWMMDGNYPPYYHDGDHPAFCKRIDRRATATLSRDVKYEEIVTRTVRTPIRKGFRQPSNNKTRATQWRNRKISSPMREVEEKVIRTLAKGTRIKVVMASRMGDVGITPNLDAHNGYVVRINCIDGEWDMFGDGKQIIPLKPEGVLVDIHPIEDPDYERVALFFPQGSPPPHQYPTE